VLLRFSHNKYRTCRINTAVGRIIMKSDIDYKEVGKRIQNFREVRGLTRALLAQKLCISEEHLEDLEAGKKQLTQENIEALRETFSVDPAWLLGGQTP
jgi:ribosome-binding protein aMBF1 (putative translation factor)